MKLNERKHGLLSILKTKHIDGHIDSKHKKILNIANKNVWILNRYGGQTVLYQQFPLTQKNMYNHAKI